MRHKVRRSRSPAGDELFWRCSTCSALSLWSDGRCTACAAALAEQPVLCVALTSFKKSFWMVAAAKGSGDVEVPLIGMLCPGCGGPFPHVTGRPTTRDGARGHTLQMHCRDCTITVPTEPAWLAA